MSCQNTNTLESAHQLLRTTTSHPQFSKAMENADVLDRILDSVGLAGLWKNSTYQGHHEVARECTALTDKLIEVSTIPYFLAQTLRLTLTCSLSLHK